MATRFYIPSTGSAAVSPAFDSDWEITTGAVRREMDDSKISSAMADMDNGDTNKTDRDYLGQQMVSKPIEAQTITAQTIKMQMRFLEPNTNNNLFMSWGLRVFSGDGLTERGVLLVVARDNTEFASSLTNRSDSRTSTEVIAQAGDRIVFEFGCGGDPTASGNHLCTARIGDTAASDLAENDSSTSDDNPWIEFANTLTFQTSTPVSNTQGTVVENIKEIVPVTQASVVENVQGNISTSLASILETVRRSVYRTTLDGTGTPDHLDGRHAISVRYRRDAAGGELLLLETKLYATGLITTRSVGLTSATEATDVYLLTSSEKSAITNYPAAELEFVVTHLGGGANAEGRITWAEFSVPFGPVGAVPVSQAQGTVLETLEVAVATRSSITESREKALASLLSIFESGQGISETTAGAVEHIAVAVASQISVLEAIEVAVATRASVTESRGKVLASLLSAVEAGQGISGASIGVVEHIESTVASQISVLEALQEIRTAIATELESKATRLLVAQGTEVENIAVTLAAQASVLESIETIESVATSSLESLQGIAQASANVLEQLQGLSATNSTEIEAKATRLLVAQQSILETIESVAASTVSEIEGLQGISDALATVIESSGVLTSAQASVVEALEAAVASRVSILEARGLLTTTQTAVLETRQVIAAMQLTAVDGQQPQRLRPSADVSVAGWTDELAGTTDIYQSIDEEVPATSDYVVST